MSNPALLFLLSLAPLKDAPFVISRVDALVADNAIQGEICGVLKARLARYYWYNFRALQDGYVIDPGTIEFAVFRSSRPGVYTALINPNGANPRMKLVASGTVDAFAKGFRLRCS